MIIEELFNTKPAIKVRYIAKELRSTNDPTKVLNCRSVPRVNIEGGAFTESNKWWVLNASPPSQPVDLTAKTAPPRVET